MTKSEINIAIAEACGWTEVKRYSIHMIAGLSPNGPGEPPMQIPDYCEDLNAMRKATEDTFTASQIQRYIEIIRLHFAHTDFQLLNLSAARRAEAFLRVIDKWQD